MTGELEVYLRKREMFEEIHRALDSLHPPLTDTEKEILEIIGKYYHDKHWNEEEQCYIMKCHPEKGCGYNDESKSTVT